MKLTEQFKYRLQELAGIAEQKEKEKLKPKSFPQPQMTGSNVMMGYTCCCDGTQTQTSVSTTF